MGIPADGLKKKWSDYLIYPHEVEKATSPLVLFIHEDVDWWILLVRKDVQLG